MAQTHESANAKAENNKRGVNSQPTSQWTDQVGASSDYDEVMGGLTLRQREVIAMQRTHGNAYVARKLKQSATTIQRIPQTVTLSETTPPTTLPRWLDVAAVYLYSPGELDTDVQNWANGDNNTFDGKYDTAFSSQFTNGKFLGVDVPQVHKSVQDALAKAETELTGLGIDNKTLAQRNFKINVIGGSVGRKAHPSSPSTNHVSQHALGFAIDIDSASNPYVLRESGETELDKQLIPVYDRIARFMLGKQDSVITRSKGGIGQGRGGSKDVFSLYSELFDESEAMKQYFRLMQDKDRLRTYLTPVDAATNPDQAGLPSGEEVKGSFTFSKMGKDEDNNPQVQQVTQLTTVSTMHIADRVQLAFGFALDTNKLDDAITKIQAQMAQDWAVLTSQKNPNADLANTPAAKSAPGDRPFDGGGAARSPLKGFMNIDYNVVQALINAGFVWGGTDFGQALGSGGSGDIMHFDLRNQHSTAAVDTLYNNMKKALNPTPPAKGK